MSTPEISIVIPAYNEEDRLPGYLREVVIFLDARAESYEVIVVDDGSIDGTAEAVERFAEHAPSVRLLRLPENRGKGYAVRIGILSACGRSRLFTDADGATSIQELSRLESAIDGGADIAIGSRALSGDSVTVKGRLHRKIMGQLFNLLVRLFAVKGIHDTQCGFKLFTASAAETIFPLLTIDDFGFDVELLYVARQHGLSISEVPVNWTDIAGTKVRIVRDSWRMLRDILRVRRNALSGFYSFERGGSR
jgi:dolichyl-phosphate beta-glucosyltransferase